MEDENNSGKRAMNESAFMRYAGKRLAIGVVITLAVLWLFVTVLGFFNKPEMEKTAHQANPTAPVAHVTAPLPSPEQHPAVATPADDGHGSTAEQQKHTVAQQSLAKLEHGAAVTSADQQDRHAAASPKPDRKSVV